MKLSALQLGCWVTEVVLLIILCSHDGSAKVVRGGKQARRFEPPKYEGETANVSLLLDGLLKGYDKRLRPNYKGPPVEVGLTMFVSSISSISEVDMDFTLDMYFRQMWTDPRLNFTKSGHADQLCINNEMLEKMWWPDTFFANAKDSKFHHTTTKNGFLRIKPSGEVIQSLRLTVTAMCNMNLMYFPMDSQICSLEIESYGYSMDDIEYLWASGSKESVSIDPAVKLPTFSVKALKMTKRVIELSTGNYSRMACVFLFGRSLGYYIIHIYIPSVLIVVLSWVSFWLSRDAVPARVALGITTVLTMTTLISSTNAALPKISYLKSIDIFLLVCFVMVFASLLEYAAVSYLANKCKRNKSKRKSSDAHAHSPASNNACKEALVRQDRVGYAMEVRLKSMSTAKAECEIPPCCADTAPLSSQGHSPGGAYRIADEDDGGCCYRFAETCLICARKPAVIDKWSRVIFPVIFLAFNLLYWFLYLHISENKDTKDFVWID